MIVDHREGTAVGHGRGCAQESLDALPGRLAALHQVRHPAEGEHRPHQLPQVQAEGGELTDREPSQADQPRAATDADQEGGAHGEVDDRVVARIDARHAQVRRGGLVRGTRQQRLGMRLRAQSAQCAQPGHALLRHRVQPAEGGLRHVEALVQLLAQAPHRPAHQRPRCQRHQRQPAAQREHHHPEHQQPGHDAVEHREHRLARRHLHGLHVVGRARHQVAGRKGAERRRRQPEQVRVDLPAQLAAE